jgi:hypothetical protein
MMPIALTMAPRYTEPEVHAKCFRSLTAAGFRDIHVFHEPGRYECWPETATEFYGTQQRLGEWHNFIRAIRTMLAKFPQADRLMTMQDDIAWCLNACERINSMPWPSAKCGAVHAYTSKRYASYAMGCVSRLIEVHARCMAGACGVVYSRAAAERLVHIADMIGWRGHTRDIIDDPQQKEGVDTFIGETLDDGKFEIWIHNPSMGQHIAKDSTLGHGGPFGSRVAANWPGEQVDALGLYADHRTLQNV